MISSSRARYSTTAVGFPVFLFAVVATLAGIAWPLSAAADLDCNQWRPVNPLPITEDLNGVAYRDGVYLAVGDNGTMLASTDKVSWQVSDSGVDNDLNAVVDHPEAFFVVGGGGTVVRGTPDTGWTTIDPVTDHDLFDVGSDGEETVVAVGDRGALVVSFDRGESWSLQTTTPIVNLSGVTWTGTRFIAVGDFGLAFASIDGLVWSPMDLGEVRDFVTIASSGERTVAIAGRGYATIITADASWTADHVQLFVTDVAWHGDRFITAGRLQYSFDGETWHRSEATGLGPGVSSVGPDWHGAGEPPAAIAVGSGGTIGHTTDGAEHWKPSNTLTGSAIHGLAATADVAVAVGGDATFSFFAAGLHGSILVSDDLDHWEVAHRSASRFTDVAANADTFMATGIVGGVYGSSGFIWTSTDGRNWEDAIQSGTGTPTLDPATYHTITWDGGRWIAAGNSGVVLVSTDGSQWHQMLLHGWDSYDGVASDGSTLIAVGGDYGLQRHAAVVISTDGETLETVDVSIDHPLLDAAFGDGVFVAVGETGVIVTSPDGRIWTPRASGVSSRLVGIRWDGTSFTAVGDNGVALTSPDGELWQPLDLGAEHGLTDFMSSPIGTIASGDHGLLLRRDCGSPDEPPVARFTWRPSHPEAGTPVQLIDLSSGDPTEWEWDLGDGVTASTPVVTHVFAEHGDWPVSLRTTNATGTDTAESTVNVRRFCGAPPPTAIHAPGRVSTGDFYEVSWDPAIETWEVGRYVLSESTSPAFDYPTDTFLSSVITGVDRLSHWQWGGAKYYRVRSINQCPDGEYASELSDTVRVEIEPDLESSLGDHVWTIPAASSSSGLKQTSWVSNVVVHNPNDEDAPSYLIHLPRVGDGEAVLGERFTVPAGSSLHIEDALAPFGENATGALVVTSDRPLQVISRTFNDRPDGSFGQFIDGVSTSTVTTPWSRDGVLIQLTEDEDARTNLALANPNRNQTRANVEAYTADGEVIGTATYTVPGLSSIFETRFLEQFTTDPVPDAYAIVEPLFFSEKMAVTASVVDERTGDPTTQAMQTLSVQSRASFVGQPAALADGYWVQIIFAFDRWFAAGEPGLAVSEDGLHWQILAGGYVRAIGFSGHRILALRGSDALISDDGEHWQILPVDGPAPHTLAWDGTRWLGVDRSFLDSLDSSTDGVHWQRSEYAMHGDDSENQRLDGLIHTADGYLGWTVHGVAHSMDAIDWEYIHFTYGPPMCEVVSNGEDHLAIGSSYTATSSDGINWEVHEQPNSPDSRRGTWAGDRWVMGAVRTNSELVAFMESRTGISWNYNWISAPQFHRSSLDVVWNGSIVMGLGFEGWIGALSGFETTVTVPAVAHENGFGGSHWRSDLELHNPHEDSIDCEIELLERGTGNDRPVSQTVTVAPLTSVRFVDVVSDTFGTEGAGALRITPNENTILVSSRTFDDTADGTYGQHVPGYHSADAIWDFEATRLIGLAHSPTRSAGFRTNIGLVSDCAKPMDVEVELFDGEGLSLGTATAHLLPYGVRQLNDVFRQMTNETVANGRAVVRTTTAQCSFYTYASVVDNGTNDPILIPVSH